MGSIVRGKINRGDMALWDGKNATSSRIDASGGTVSGLAINDFVDLLQVFGAGTARTSGTANSAVGFVGTTTCTFMFAPGTWDFSANVTFPSTVTCYIAAGAVITPSVGITVTFSGPVIHEATTWTGGAGTVVTTLGQAGLIDIADAGSKYTATTVEAAFAELAATTGAGIIGLLDSGGNFTATTVEAALAELASVATGEGASIIGVEDSAGNFTATDVEAVLTELQANIDGITTAGSFTGTLTGCTTSPTATFYYSVTDLDGTYSEVKLWCPAGLSATSNAATLTVTGLPAAIQSASTQARANTHSIDNSNTIPSLITITAGASVLNFNVFTGTNYSSLAYTTSGTKGINTGWNLSYIID
jgi:hypothetical protein